MQEKEKIYSKPHTKFLDPMINPSWRKVTSGKYIHNCSETKHEQIVIFSYSRNIVITPNQPSDQLN